MTVSPSFDSYETQFERQGYGHFPEQLSASPFLDGALTFAVEQALTGGLVKQQRVTHSGNGPEISTAYTSNLIIREGDYITDIEPNQADALLLAWSADKLLGEYRKPHLPLNAYVQSYAPRNKIPWHIDSSSFQLSHGGFVALDDGRETTYQSLTSLAKTTIRSRPGTVTAASVRELEESTNKLPLHMVAATVTTGLTHTIGFSRMRTGFDESDMEILNERRLDELSSSSQ